MSSLQKINDLEEYILYEASIECSICKEKDTTGFTEEAAEYFYKQGWRVVFKDDGIELCLCEKCGKEKK